MKRPKEIQKLKIALTTDCVLACRHCRIDKGAGLTIGFAAAARGVDLLLSSPGGLKRLELYGGEPFLKFELLKRVAEYARRGAARAGKKLSVSVASNGLVLDKERLAFIRDNRVNLSISVSGSRGNHDRTRVYPGGRGSFGDLAKKLAVVLSALDREEVVALECVAPAGAATLGADLKQLARTGFRVMNVECVHGCNWSPSALAALERSLNSFSAWLFSEIKRGGYIAPEPFLEFLRVRGSGRGPDCPLYRDLELYPDGTLSFYPFAFIDYPERKKTVAIGSASRGLRARYGSCVPGGKACAGCVSDYYVVEGLSSGAAAYRLRTAVLKKMFLEIMRRSRTEKAFNGYARWLSGLARKTYAAPGRKAR